MNRTLSTRVCPSSGLTRADPTSPGCAIAAVGIITALGGGVEETWSRLVAGDQSRLTSRFNLVPGRCLRVGAVTDPLPEIPPHLGRYGCRNNALTLAAVTQIDPLLRGVIDEVGAERVGVVMGSSTSGVAAAEEAIRHRARTGRLPDQFDYVQLEFGGLAEFLAAYTGVLGPAYTLSTACSSGAKALAAARSLLALDLCDAVLAGGADSLCGLTTNGFTALQAISDEPSNAFSVNRKGLTIGEGAAVFLLTRDQGEIQLAGAGEASDAFHMSSPDPDGAGAEAAMRAALSDAAVEAPAVSYVNLHGTGTPFNDAMESKAVSRIFGDRVPCSSTKPMVGHTLGAAGAVELGFCWMMLKHWSPSEGLPLLPHCWDGARDPALPPLRFSVKGERVRATGAVLVVSNSFGFGGNNCSLVLKMEAPC